MGPQKFRLKGFRFKLLDGGAETLHIGLREEESGLRRDGFQRTALSQRDDRGSRRLRLKALQLTLRS